MDSNDPCAGIADGLPISREYIRQFFQSDIYTNASAEVQVEYTREVLYRIYRNNKVCQAIQDWKKRVSLQESQVAINRNRAHQLLSQINDIEHDSGQKKQELRELVATLLYDVLKLPEPLKLEDGTATIPLPPSQKAVDKGFVYKLLDSIADISNDSHSTTDEKPSSVWPDCGEPRSRIKKQQPQTSWAIPTMPEPYIHSIVRDGFGPWRSSSTEASEASISTLGNKELSQLDLAAKSEKLFNAPPRRITDRRKSTKDLGF